METSEVSVQEHVSWSPSFLLSKFSGSVLQLQAQISPLRSETIHTIQKLHCSLWSFIYDSGKRPVSDTGDFYNAPVSPNQLLDYLILFVCLMAGKPTMTFSFMYVMEEAGATSEGSALLAGV